MGEQDIKLNKIRRHKHQAVDNPDKKLHRNAEEFQTDDTTY